METVLGLSFQDCLLSRQKLWYVEGVCLFCKLPFFLPSLHEVRVDGQTAAPMT